MHTREGERVKLREIKIHVCCRCRSINQTLTLQLFCKVAPLPQIDQSNRNRSYSRPAALELAGLKREEGGMRCDAFDRLLPIPTLTSGIRSSETPGRGLECRDIIFFFGGLSIHSFCYTVFPFSN